MIGNASIYPVIQVTPEHSVLSTSPEDSRGPGKSSTKFEGKHKFLPFHARFSEAALELVHVNTSILVGVETFEGFFEEGSSLLVDDDGSLLSGPSSEQKISASFSGGLEASASPKDSCAFFSCRGIVRGGADPLLVTGTVE